MARERLTHPAAAAPVLHPRWIFYIHTRPYSEADRTRLTRFITSLSNLTEASIFVYNLYKLFTVLIISPTFKTPVPKG